MELKTASQTLSEITGIPVYRIDADDNGEYITKKGAKMAIESHTNERLAKLREMLEVAKLKITGDADYYHGEVSGLEEALSLLDQL